LSNREREGSLKVKELKFINKNHQKEIKRNKK
jgi:hypothetical protein